MRVPLGQRQGAVILQLNHAFERAQWTSSDEAEEIPGVDSVAPATLNAIASNMADRRYSKGPQINNELLNRIKPSSNAIAAQKELLKAMVERWQEPRLGFEGFPAAGGLYVSLLEATGLHGVRSDDPSRARFVDPSPDGRARLAPLWDTAESVFKAAGPAGMELSGLYAVWRDPSYGVRDGLLPVLAIAFLMSRAGRLAVYLDGAFQPKVSAILIDRLTQDPASVRLRWTEASDFHVEVLGAVADLVGEFGGMAESPTHPETIEVARALVGLVLDLPAWVQKTGQLTPTASKVRNLAKLASDPNKFLLDDLPAVFTEGPALTGADAGRVISALREGLSELVGAYPRMLHHLEEVMQRELRVVKVTAAAMDALHGRAEIVRGLTGNYRLDAFATRLSSYGGEIEEIEGIASLAANKPPRDWVDRDIDHARIEIGALCRPGRAIKGRKPGR